MIRRILWGLLGAVAGLVLAIFVSLQTGVAMILAGWTQSDVEALTRLLSLAGIVVGGGAGLIWGGSRKGAGRPGAAPEPKAPPPPRKWGRQ